MKKAGAIIYMYIHVYIVHCTKDTYTCISKLYCTCTCKMYIVSTCVDTCTYTCIPYIFKVHKFRGSCHLKCFVETIFVDLSVYDTLCNTQVMFRGLNFCGSEPICESHKQYGPRKSGAVHVHVHTM